MTLEEYKNKLKEIKNKADEETKKLHIKYAYENRVANIGDIIIGDYENIKVESFRYSVYSEICTISYFGLKLKKNLEPFKNADKTVLYHDRIKEVIKNN